MSKANKQTNETAQSQTDSGNETAQPVVLKTICKELKLDPKLARRKLRKAWRAENSTVQHKFRERWTGEYIRSILAPKQEQPESKQ